MKEVTRAIIINNKGEVLVGKRARKDGVGQWALVGGKLDIGETPEDCVIREVHEELGLVFSPTLWKEEIDTSAGDGSAWKVYYFMGHVTGEIQRKEDEITETLYISSKDVDSLAIAFGHEKILRDFFTKNIPS